MSEEQLKAFLEKVQDDKNLQEKLRAAANADVASTIAKEAGFSISVEDLNKAQSEVLLQTDISDAELEGVNGGFSFSSTFFKVTLNRDHKTLG